MLKIHAATTGKAVATIPIASSEFTSAEAAAFVPDTACVVVAASVMPDGNFIAFACGGEPPAGGVFLYERSADQWRLTKATRIQNAPPATRGDAGNTRPLRVYGTDVTMDTVGNFNLPANRRSAKCPRCTLPDLDAVPEPYLLSRGFTAPGDFSTAELGNFFVREFARRVLEIAAPSACRFFPTYEAKSGRPTDWFLAVPQTTVQTAKLPDKGVKCRECGEPKTMSHLVPPEQDPAYEQPCQSDLRPVASPGFPG